MTKYCNIKNFPALNKPFKLIAFDWDGTAVINRKVDASLVTSRIEDLLKLNVYIAVITGTNFYNIDRQFSSHINEKYKQYLYVCTNRGSEVYGFDENSKPIALYRLVANDEENKLLDKIVEKTKKEIEGTSNVTINIVYNRMNRRKLDLIPEWEDPPKSEIDKLLQETQSRLKNGGFAGGIKKAFKLIENIAKTSGLPKAKITSDVKHLEVGLTDKSDSIKWILENIVRKNNISNSEILVGGDEFGPIATFEGSDDKMIINPVTDITYFSVGIEPNGVPKPVIYLGGGPDCFVKLMEFQIAFHSNPKL